MAGHETIEKFVYEKTYFKIQVNSAFIHFQTFVVFYYNKPGN